MATGGGTPEEGTLDQDLPNWSHESLEDRLNNMDWSGEWSGQKKANRSSEKNKKKFGMECEARLTNDISPGSSPGVGRRRTRTPHTYPHTRYISQMSVPEQAELERLKQKINFGDLDQRSIGSDSQGRATAANNKRQLSENRKPFNFLPLQLNTNKDKATTPSPPKRETSVSSLPKDFLTSAYAKDMGHSFQASLSDDVREEEAIDSSQALDPQQEAKEELKNMKKQHALLTRILQQQEQLRALKGRQAALLALQHKTEQAIAVMDDSVVTETTGSVSGLSLTSELNEELNDLIQRFHNQLHDVQGPPVPDNRRQAESLSLTREVSRSLNSSISEPVLEDRTPLFSKVGVVLEKKHKMDSILGELHTLQDHHLNNTACSPQRGVDQRSVSSAASAPQTSDNRATNSPAAVSVFPSANSINDSEDEENQNPAEKLKKLKEVRKRLNELRDLVRYYEQTSDMMTDAINENTKDEDEEETEDSWIESDQEVNQPVINIRNPRLSSWGPVNSISNSNCGNNNRDERPLNTDCEINNRSSVNLRTFNVSSALECLYNRESRDEEQHRNVDLNDEDEDADDDADDDQESVVSLSSRSSATEEAQTAEYEEKFNRLVAAKHKLKQLQDLIAMYDGDTESETMAAERSANGGHSLPEESSHKQQPNNTRPNVSKTQKDVALKEQAREKFYESKLQQQQKELKQLQEERKKLIEIQEKIQTLRKACPDLELSSSSFKSGQTTRNIPTTSSTPEVNVSNAAAIPNMPDPEDSSSVDNEVWSEIRWNQILREDLRQRRKQLESLMAEHQRRQGQEITSAASLRSDDSETQGLHHQSRTEKTMATWGGSTQCALDEDDEDDACISDINQVEDEEEEEQEDTFHENVTHPQSSINQSACTGNNNKQGLKGQHPYAVDGNYRPSPRTRQQQNISMRRQENLRWVSELSQVEEKNLWQEQIDQIKKQLDFSTNMCQTLMRDQQSLYYLLQSMCTNPYNMMPSNLGTSQVHLIMHQLNQCYTQLNWQQNNVLRLKQMLSDVMHQQQEPMQQNSQQRKPQESSAAPPGSPNAFDQFGFLPPPMNVFNMPPFGSFPNMMPGVNFNPVFQHGIGDFSRASNSHTDVPLQSHDPNTSGKTEYMAFPKPFESNSSTAGDRQSTAPKVAEGERNRSLQSESQSKDEEKKPSSMDAPRSASGCSFRHSEAACRVKQFDEESMDSLSSMPDPVDPTTVTKTFKSLKASAQASLASKDKTPKNKNKKRKISHQRNRGLKNLELQSASASSITEPKESSSKHAQTEETGAGKPITSEHLQRLRKDSKAADISSEAGSDFSMFEALRDTIYSEVATLISQNECRPQFLIELFHELQLLNTDYLRQKALFALQDIVTRRVTENIERKHDCSKPLDSLGWMASNSELTPSESLATTDDEMYAKNSNSQACNDGEKNDVDNISTLSTSSLFEPFATDDLGNTVIHLDQALARMREYERMKIEAENSLDAECCSKLNNAATNIEGSNDEEGEQSKQCSDDGSAVPCPRIDTQQLDRQIKAIMKEVIPFLKEHMEEVCSSHLLTSIRRMVLTLTQQNDESKEFVKFFHKQLGSILQDSLEKFSNKKLKDCGEDLLVEISEVLFNELAFFRLMQDLDNNSSSVQSRGQHKSNTDVLQSFTKKARILLDGVESSDTRESDDEDKDKDETEIVSKSQNKCIDVSEAHSGRSDISEEEDGNENIPVSISLSKAETQALTNYGSGEDENEEEEENYEFEARPVDVQTSLEANAETTDENEKEQILKNPINETETEGEYTAKLCIQEAEDGQKLQEEQNQPNILADNVSDSLNLNKDADMSASVDIDTKSSLASAESSGPGSPATDSPVLVNEYETGSGNLSQKSDEDDFVKLEDLPLKLALPKAELIAEMEKEQLNNNLCDEILNGQGPGADLLAGDALSLKEPESNGAHSG